MKYLLTWRGLGYVCDDKLNLLNLTSVLGFDLIMVELKFKKPDVPLVPKHQASDHTSLP